MNTYRGLRLSGQIYFHFMKPSILKAFRTLFSRHQTHRLNMARLLQIDVKCVAKFAFVRGNLSKRVFFHKTHRFLPLYVLGNRSKALLLPIICKRTDLPTASRLRSEGTSLKSHRLNSDTCLCYSSFTPFIASSAFRIISSCSLLQKGFSLSIS